MLSYNTILFDMDGTIFDTLEDTSAAVNHMCNALGLPMRTTAEVSAGMGRGIDNLVRASLPDNATDLEAQAIRLYREYYARHYMDFSKPYDGILELLGRLKAFGAKTAVISNKSEEFTMNIVEKLFNGLFDFTLGEMPGQPLKPDPAPVMKTLEALGADAKSAVYVGDTEIDMLTAKNSGIACITCAWGLRGRELLLQSGADASMIADTPADVLRILGGV